MAHGAAPLGLHGQMAEALRILCVGSAACMRADLAEAAVLGVSEAEGWVVVAVNHAGRDWPGELPHWASFHCELFPRWIPERQAAGRTPAGELWTGEHRGQPPGLSLKRAPNWGGSSGLLAVSVALKLRAERVVCCGIPLDHEQGHFDKPEVKWRDATNYRRGWVSHQVEMADRVRSMSGWTAGLLGRPDAEWLAAPGVAA